MNELYYNMTCSDEPYSHFSHTKRMCRHKYKYLCIIMSRSDKRILLYTYDLRLTWNILDTHLFCNFTNYLN